MMMRAKDLSVLLVLALSMAAIATRAQEKDAKPAEKPADAAPARR
jgi:hypothetical protein